MCVTSPLDPIDNTIPTNTLTPLNASVLVAGQVGIRHDHREQPEQAGQQTLGRLGGVGMHPGQMDAPLPDAVERRLHDANDQPRQHDDDEDVEQIPGGRSRCPCRSAGTCEPGTLQGLRPMGAWYREEDQGGNQPDVDGEQGERRRQGPDGAPEPEHEPAGIDGHVSGQVCALELLFRQVAHPLAQGVVHAPQDPERRSQQHGETKRGHARAKEVSRLPRLRELIERAFEFPACAERHLDLLARQVVGVGRRHREHVVPGRGDHDEIQNRAAGSRGDAAVSRTGRRFGFSRRRHVQRASA